MPTFVCLCVRLLHLKKQTRGFLFDRAPFVLSSSFAMQNTASQNTVCLVLSIAELRAMLAIAEAKSKEVYGKKVRHSTVTLKGEVSKEYPDLISSPTVTVCGQSLMMLAHT